MVVELRPLRVRAEEFEILEKRIKRAFREILYEPLMKDLELSPSMVMNSEVAIIDALRKGKISFNRGAFRGSFNAAISRELQKLGAIWDRKSKVWRISRSDLPYGILQAIDAGEKKFSLVMDRVTDTLGKILPEKIAELVQSANIFDDVLWKTNRDFESTVQGITVVPKLSKSARARIAEEWQNNMDLWIKDFTESEIVRLRKLVQRSTLAGNRYESLIASIRDSYGVTARKAHFLARQETNLLLSKFRDTRYTEAGVYEYRWRCVIGSPAHPVRPSHLVLDGKIFRWDDPPITTPKGEPERRNNPGQDYNCRCMAIPIVR